MANKTVSEFTFVYSASSWRAAPCIGANKPAFSFDVTQYAGTEKHLGRMRPTNYVASQIPIFNAKLRG